ncbi:MAG: FAA hydrolase family protein [Xanthobacteraceae bacterium]|nr:MAG: FAA hydrolase family protein [Xanthobacteraceae bacterium]
MKLVRYGERGKERPGLIDAAGRLRDLSSHAVDIAGDVLAPQGLARLAALDTATLPAVEGTPRLGPPVGAFSKFICIGLNYIDHATETGARPPAEPVVFLKANSAIAGPDDAIVQPRGSTKLDWEVELAVVIGSRAKYVGEGQALDHVAGYCLANDVSERGFQLERAGQWTKGKSCDGFGPLGPWLVTRDEIADPQALSMWLDVNGTRRQHGSTSNMIFSVAKLISYLSGFFTLEPGDIISTGTPAGVGLGMKPPTFLKAGDVVTLGIDGLGSQTQRVVADR